MTTRTLAVVTAGLSQPSATRLLADRLVAATEQALRDRGVTPNIEIVELRDHAHALTDHLLTGFPSPALGEAIDTVKGADGLIAVTPIFTASYSGLFKTFFDVLGPDALIDTPTLIGATAGTARHSLALDHALRPMFTYLRAVVVPTAVFAASEDWGAGDSSTSSASTTGALAGRITRAAGELASLVAARESRAPVDPFDNPTPFEQLLAGG
jgi:FMN reductase